MGLLTCCDMRGIYPCAVVHAVFGSAPYLMFFIFNPLQVYTAEYIARYIPATTSFLYQWFDDEQFWFTVGYALIMVSAYTIRFSLLVLLYYY